MVGNKEEPFPKVREAETRCTEHSPFRIEPSVPKVLQDSTEHVAIFNICIMYS
jgi:hypothetical protein